jgi:hypothetical protein
MDKPQANSTSVLLEKLDDEAKALLVAAVMLTGLTELAQARAALYEAANVLGEGELARKCREAASTLSDEKLLPFCLEHSESWRSQAIARFRYVETERARTATAT